jgi:hypothetical protein
MIRYARIAASIVVAVAMGVLAMADGASAHSGRFAVFDQCPSTNPEVKQCLYSVTTGGTVVLGSASTPIRNPVVVQGGFKFNFEAENYTFYDASDGQTLVPTPQPVPGGLLGVVKPEEFTEPLKAILEAVLENGFTGVNATLELASSTVGFNERNLLAEEGVALELPVKVRLENPFLGSNCYIGSNTEPIMWNLTTGTTSPPAPNKPISGKTGFLDGEEEGGLITKITGDELVDNSFSAPGATGCGPLPLSEIIVDPVIDAKLELPSAKGKNSAVLKNEVEVAEARVVNEH